MSRLREFIHVEHIEQCLMASKLNKCSFQEDTWSKEKNIGFFIVGLIKKCLMFGYSVTSAETAVFMWLLLPNHSLHVLLSGFVFSTRSLKVTEDKGLFYVSLNPPTVPSS